MESRSVLHSISVWSRMVGKDFILLRKDFRPRLILHFFRVFLSIEFEWSSDVGEKCVKERCMLC